MFTHRIISKEFENGVLVLGVEFTDGEKVITEAVKPQDEVGFKHWLTARLTSLNSLVELEKININDSVDVDVDVVPVDTRTPAEIERDVWLKKYYKWVNIKNNLINTGILTGSEKPVVDFLADVKVGFKPAYLDFI